MRCYRYLRKNKDMYDNAMRKVLFNFNIRCSKNNKLYIVILTFVNTFTHNHLFD